MNTLQFLSPKIVPDIRGEKNEALKLVAVWTYANAKGHLKHGEMYKIEREKSPQGNLYRDAFEDGRLFMNKGQWRGNADCNGPTKTLHYKCKEMRDHV
jgi:hypothetical protein